MLLTFSPDVENESCIVVLLVDLSELLELFPLINIFEFPAIPLACFSFCDDVSSSVDILADIVDFFNAKLAFLTFEYSGEAGTLSTFEFGFEGDL